MIKQLLLVLTALLLFCSEALPQCNLTASITVVSGTNVCANYAVLTALPKSESWVQKTSFGGSTRQSPTGFSVGTKGYIGLGNGSADLWEYDPATNAWTQKANYPTSLIDYPLGFSIGTKGYVAAVGLFGELFYEYNPSTNAWSSKATPGGGIRILGFAFSTATKGYIGTGLTTLLIGKNDFWEYNPTTDTWTQKANYGGGARFNAVAIGNGTLGYVGTGYDALFNGYTDFWEYNPTSDIWTQKSNYPGNNSSTPNVGFSINAKPYVFEPTTTFGNNFYEYTPATNTWLAKASNTISSLTDAAGFSIGSKGYVGAGSASTNFWEYNALITYTWSTGANTQTIAVSSSGNYSVSMTDVLSCTATATKNMSVNPSPNVIVTGGNVCTGSTATLTASGATSYTWSANVGGGNSANAITTPSSSTFYTISATGPGSCTVSAVRAIVLVPLPTASVISPSASVCGTSLALTAAPPGNTWTAKSNVGGSTRWRAVAFSIGAKGYIGLGLNSSFIRVNDFWEYDPTTNAWTQKANFPGVGINSNVGFSIGSKGYAGTAFNADFWEYDPAGNSWVQKADFPGGNRSDAVGFSIGSRGYMGTGTDLSNNPTNDFWEYDPTVNSWSQRADFGGGIRRYATAVSIGGKGYMGLGQDATFATKNDIWEFDPLTNAWTQKSNFPGSAGAFATAFTLNSKGYFNPGGVNSFYEYTPATDSWLQKTALSGFRGYEASFSIGGKGYCGTGLNGLTYYNDFYEYDPNEFFLWSTSAVTNSISVTSTASYSVLVTSALGCSASAAKAVTINPIPIITSTASIPAICLGGTTTLSAGGASTYVWTGGVTNAVAFSPTTTLTYTVTGTAATGCTNTAVNTVTVNSLPTVSAVATNSVICLGGSTSLSGTGASSYVWTSGITDGLPFSPTTTLTYTVTGTNALTTCTNTAVKTITVNILPTVVGNATPSVICLNASLTLSGSGASTYTWSNGVTNGVAFSPSVSGTYTVTGTSALNCTNTAVKSITVNSLPIVTASSGNSVICFGATTSLNGGGAVSYIWSNSVANGTPFSPTTTASYTVIGTSANTCTNAAVTSVTVNSLPVITINASNTVICIGGTVSLSGMGAATYTWISSISNGVAFSPTSTAAYTVSGTDGLTTCTNTAVKTVTVNSLPTVGATVSQSVICLNNTTILNGTGASTYTWSNGVSNGVAFSPSVSGTYTVTGTSALNCTNTAIKSITVNSLPLVTAASSNSVICIGATTSLNGGGASTYAWSNSVLNGTNFSPTLTASYTVTGTDANTCTNTAVTSVTVNALPAVTANASNTVICIGGTVSLSGGGATTYTWANSIINGLAFSPTSTAVYTVTGTDVNTCTNTAVRSVTVNSLPIVGATVTQSIICLNNSTTLNGTGATTYTWTNGVTNGLTFSPTITATYTVTGTSALNCTNTAVKSITVNSLPIVTASPSNSVICIGATTSLNGGGATTYVWSNSVPNGTSFSPTLTASYTVTGTDANTCTNTAVTSVTVNTLPAVTANASNTVICSGGTVSLNGGGATTYTWTNSIIDGLAFSPTSTAVYTVTGTDANTCTNIAVRTITVNALPGVGATVTQSVICLNNSTTLNGTGATTYTWTNGVTNGLAFSPTITATYTVTGKSALNCTNTAVKTITVNNLPLVTTSITNPVICIGGTTSVSGVGAITYTWTNGITNGATISPTVNTTYTVTGTDANTCTNTAIASISVNALPVVTANASSTVICVGNTVTLFGGGVTTYTWSNSITNNVSFSPGTTATYTVIGTSALTTCTNTATRNIVVNNLPAVTANATNPVICLNGLTTLNGGGASTYTWTGGVINGSAFSPPVSTNFTVTGTDLNSCTNTAVAFIAVNVLPVVTASSSNSILCIGSSVVLTGGGANTYTWTNGVTDGVSFSPSLTANYTVTGTDLNTCTNTAITTVTVYNSAPVTANTSSSVVCAGDAVTLTGGGAVTFTWTGSVTNGNPFVPLFTNTYTVTGTDANGCLGTAALGVTVNPLPIVTSTVSYPVVCLNHTTSVAGGGAVIYLWTGGIINAVAFAPSTTTTYTLTGIDANGCVNYDSKQIIVNPLPIVTANISNPVICTGDPTSLTGGGAIFYSWTGGILDGFPFTPMVTASYTVTGMDANSCTNTAVATIIVNNSPTVTASSSNSVICNGDFTTLNGGGASSYVWTGNVSDATAFNPSSTASYTVIGTAANGCTNSAITSITVNALPLVTANTSHSAICLNYTTSVSGGGAVTYTWTNGLTNNTTFTPTITDTYTVTGTDANGCQNTALQTIVVNPLPPVSGAATSPVICDGDFTTLNGSGAITYTWTGGITDGIAFSPSLTLSYQVTGTDANTCSNTAVVIVTVNPTPTVTASSSTSVICMNDFTTLNGGGAVSYAWTGNVTDGISFSPTITASYTVTGISIDGCTNTAVTSVTVNALPNVIGTASTPTICIGDITSLNGGGAQIYSWSSGIANGVAFSPIATTVYTVTGTDVNGCVNTSTALVTVKPRPIITASALPPVICRGDLTTLAGSGALSYNWTSGVQNGIAFSPTTTTSYSVVGNTNGCLSYNTVVLTITVNALPLVTAHGGSICAGNSFTLSSAGAVTYTFSNGQVVSPSGTTTYSVWGTNAEGCVNSVPAVATVTVKTLPIIYLSSTQNTVCTGNSATISATGASNYIWGNGNSTSTIVVSPLTATMYSVSGTDTNMCTGFSTISLAVVNMPKVTLASNLAAACRGGEFILTANGADAYRWNTGDTTTSIKETPATTSVYSVTGTNGGVCSETKTITITLYSIPLLDAGADIEIQAGQTAQLNATQNGASIYAWSSEEGLSNPSILNPIVTTDYDITYTLTVTSSKGCVAKDEVSIKVLDGLTVANYMSPNGDGKNDTWKISNLYLVRNYSIEIVNGWGKTVFSKSDNYANEFDAQDLPDGVYYYFIKDGTKSKYKGSITITR